LITTLRIQKKAEAFGYKYTKKKGEKTEQVGLMSQKRTGDGRLVAGEGTGDRDQRKEMSSRSSLIVIINS
jgi:hypothetical protein